MQNLRNPWWLVSISIIPIAILGWIFYGSFQLLESLLSEESIADWVRFGRVLGALWVIHALYTFDMIRRRKKLDHWYSVITLCVYSAFLYLYSINYGDLIPFNIPGWMAPDNMILYSGSFIMPTLIHCILVLVMYFTQQPRQKKAWHNFLFALLVPLLWYGLFQLILPLWRSSHDLGMHGGVVFTIISTITFLFFIVRGIYLVSIKNGRFFKRYQLVWKALFALAFPITGLIVNNKMMYDFAFGNFSDPWFFILAVVNGIAVCLPELDRKYYRLVLFTVRSITFTYILYFFLVFLPYLPLSIIAIVVFGLGFLMLTPLILMIVQIKILVDDFVFLYRHYSRRTVLVLFSASISLIPLSVTATYLKDRNVLHKALSYVYEADYLNLSGHEVNTHTLKQVLEYIWNVKHESISLVHRIPFLSMYYNWITLDNLALSSEKINELQNIFLGTPPPDNPSPPQGNDWVILTEAVTTSTYIPEKNTG